MALVFSSAMMFECIGEAVAAQRIRKAIDAVYTKGEYLTGDMTKKGVANVSTSIFVAAVIGEMRNVEVKAA